MICIYCDSETRVTNSRLQKRSNQIWRRRKCTACGAVFTSHEAIDLSSSLIVDYGALQKPLLIDKLFTEVLLALQDQKDCYVTAREITSTVIAELLKLPEKPIFKSQTISQIAAKVLKRFNRQAWLRYVSEHPSLQSKQKLVTSD